MTQAESKLSNAIRQGLKAHYGGDIFIFKVWGSEHMMAGLPDLIGCCRGRFIGLEVKRPETRLNTSARQKWVGSLIQRAGGVWAVVVNLQEAMAVIEPSVDP